MDIIVEKTQHKTVKQREKGKFLEASLPYIYILPVFLFLAVFVLRPFLFAIEKSFYKYDGMGINEFVGLKNYSYLFLQDEMFWISVQNFLYFFAWLFICFSFPVLAAELLYNLKNTRHQEVIRTLLIIPIVVPLVVTVLVWKFMYYPGIGVFARIFEMFGTDAPNFLGSEFWVKPALIIIGFPWVAGLNLLVTFAALQGLDHSVIEASRIDGCGTIRRVFLIDLPIVLPQIKALFVLAVIGLIQDYEKVFIITQGGPNNASLTPGLHMYNAAFSGSNGSGGFGYSCAMAVVMFLVTLVFTVFTMRSSNKN